ncbi:plasmid mobilization protein [Streptomyces tirandamycinicus]
MKRIRVRVHDDQFAEIQQAAREAGQTIAEWIREAARRRSSAASKSA